VQRLAYYPAGHQDTWLRSISGCQLLQVWSFGIGSWITDVEYQARRIVFCPCLFSVCYRSSSGWSPLRMLGAVELCRQPLICQNTRVFVEVRVLTQRCGRKKMRRTVCFTATFTDMMWTWTLQNTFVHSIHICRYTTESVLWLCWQDRYGSLPFLQINNHQFTIAEKSRGAHNRPNVHLHQGSCQWLCVTWKEIKKLKQKHNDNEKGKTKYQIKLKKVKFTT